MGGFPNPQAVKVIVAAAKTAAFRYYCERTAERAVTWAHSINPRIPSWEAMGQFERDGLRDMMITHLAVNRALMIEPLPGYLG